jgi:hypothetical protein
MRVRRGGRIGRKREGRTTPATCPALGTSRTPHERTGGSIDAPTTARTPKRQSVRQAARKADGRDKCTLLLDADTSLKLTVAAHLRGLDRSELVNELLADALRHVIISLRGQSNGSAIPAADVSPAAPAPAV